MKANSVFKSIEKSRVNVMNCNAMRNGSLGQRLPVNERDGRFVTRLNAVLISLG